MNSLNPALIAVVQNSLKGARLEKFNESVNAINESLAAGGWVSRGSQKAHKGFGQGIGLKFSVRYEHSVEGTEDRALYSALTFGSYSENLGSAIDRLLVKTNVLTDKLVVNQKKFSRELLEAWVLLCNEKRMAVELLDTYRPLPVITEIGLSPRVTATLTEMNLDVSLPSIKPAKIGRRMVPAFSRTGEPLFSRNGERLLVPEYYIDWTPGTIFGRSRFSYGCHCEACGKSIPSGRFVAIEADDNKSGEHIGLFIGQDCASNIFGVKDAGMERV